MAKQSSKTRVTVRLDPETAKLLENASAGKYGVLSDLADQAIRHWFKPEADQHFSIMARRLDDMQSDMRRMAEDQIVVMQAVNTFVWFYLLMTPAVSPTTQKDNKAVALKRYQDFLRRLGKDVRAETHLSDLVLQEEDVPSDVLGDLSVDPAEEARGERLQ